MVTRVIWSYEEPTRRVGHPAKKEKLGQLGCCLVAIVLSVCCSSSTAPTNDGYSLFDSMAKWYNDGTKILFVRDCGCLPDSENGLYYMTWPDLIETRLENPLPVFNPSLDPSDSLVVYHTRTMQLYIAELNSKESTQITSNGGGCVLPSWSPDGSRIAYNVSAGDERGLYIYGISDHISKFCLKYARSASWFSDGGRLACLAYYKELNSFELAIYDVAADSVGFLTKNGCIKWLCEPSPDGSSIALVQTCGIGSRQIFVVDIETGRESQLTYTGGDYPDWSPDGAWIVYTNSSRQNGRLWVMRPDGSSKQQITH